MSIIIKSTDSIKSSEITSESVYHNRRRFLKRSSLLLGAAYTGVIKPAYSISDSFNSAESSTYSTDESKNTFKEITEYNNFYEFGTRKTDPAKNAVHFKPRPWSISVEGEVKNAGPIDFEDILSQYTMEERIYRFRCVEGWSMVVPWVGFPLSALIKKLQPTSRAKYVEFTTLYDAKRMPGQKRRVLRWPYTEGLRIDEAMNPLALLAVGLYGQAMPNQNGAPIRLVVPWKYGFKSIKSIVKIRFTETQPASTWNITAPKEYGFYSNVNPDVDHPRWSQKTERKIGTKFWAPKQYTKMFNGYEEQVAHMYKNMNLTKFF